MRQCVFFLILITSIVSFSKEIKVVILDTGIDLKNYPYKNKIKTIEKDYKDYDGHGTHVVSTIIKYTKVKNFKIIPIKVFFETSSVKELDLKETEESEYFLAEAVKKVKKTGAKIVNISAGGNRFYKKDYEAIKNNPDILFIVASGNEVFKIDEKSEYKKYNNVKDLDFFELLKMTNKNEFKYSFYPCAFKLDNVICVGNATIKDKEVSVHSNYGSFVVDVFANGQEQVNIGLDGEEYTLSGSSVSTPKITALAINELSKNSKIKILDLKQKIFSNLVFIDQLKEKSKTGLFLKED